MLSALGAQRFQERPQNSSVIQGQTVVLKCVVLDRTGRIQWVKDGFALGKATYCFAFVLVNPLFLNRIIALKSSPNAVSGKGRG